MDEKKIYIIQFRYTDDGQIYENELLLSSDELVKVHAFYAALLASGDIEPLDPTDTDHVDSILFPKLIVEPTTFDQLREQIFGEGGGYIAARAGELEITL